MKKPEWSKEQIRDEIQSKVNLIREVVEDNAQVKIGDPHWHEKDDLGNNWNLSVISNGSAYTREISLIIEELRGRVNLKK